MLDQLVGQFMQSAPGKDVLAQLTQKGLDGPQAQAALTATAEGAIQQGGGALGGLAGLVGGGGGGALGGLAGMMGSAAPAAGGGMGASVAQFVAQKTGLSPAIAQMVVSVALPKLLELVQGRAAAPAAPAGPAAANGIGGMLGGLSGLLK